VTRKLALLFILAAISTHAQSYTTNFPATENPINQSGNWLNGHTNGLDWGDVQTTPGLAFGTTVSGGPPYTDSTAVLTGSWPSNQSACGVVTQNLSTAQRNSFFPEVEIRLRVTIASHSITGYEINYSMGNNAGSGHLYAGIVRWNGALNNFTGLAATPTAGSLTALQTGDIFCATIVGSAITGTATRAGTVLYSFTASDSTYTSGSPGIGFYNGGGLSAENSLYGFSSFRTPQTASGTFTASSCNQGDVNEVINGTGGTTPPISPHNAVDGDTINIPAGGCTWTGTIPVNSNIGIQIVGACTPNTLPSQFGAGTVTTSITHGGFSMSPTFGNSLSRISCLNLLPSSGAGAPISVNGTCTAAGCPNLRLDNLIFPTSWSNLGLSDGSVTIISNMFGVADHNTVGDVAPTVNYVNFMNVGHGEWQGIGGFGDNSFATAPSLGSTQMMMLENNSFAYSLPTDTDIPDPSPLGGGARFGCRFNHSNPMNINGYCTGHGTETTGRPRGVAQWEAYFNTGVCTNTAQGCGSAWPGRSGSGRSFSNTFSNSGGGFFSGLNNMDAQRRWRPQSVLVFGGCNTLSPYDTNDGGATPTIYASGTVTAPSVNNLGPETYTITTSGAWGGGFTPLVYGSPYTFFDVTGQFGFEIQHFTANTLTVYVGCQGTSCSGSGPPSGLPAMGDTYQIRRSTVCIDQPTRFQGALLSGYHNPTPVAPVNQALTPSYEANDAGPASMNHTLSSNTFSIIPNRDFYTEAPNQMAQTSATAPFNGAANTIAISGWSCNFSLNSCTYNVADTTGFQRGSYAQIGGVALGTLHSYNPTGTFPIASLVANTSLTLTIPGPFTDNAGLGGAASTPGMGHGTLANRPTTCTTGVGYWATDQGTWDMSGGGNKGLMYRCSSTNTWSLDYTPACYPSALITGSPCSGAATAPIVSLSPSSLAFGNILVGSSSAAQNITLSNTGTATLTISSIAPGGTNSADFSQTNNCSGSVNVGGSCVIAVKFTPLSAAAFSANITVTDNAAGSPHTAALSGTGITATAGISFSPTSLTFASQTVGTSSAPQSVTVTNTGSGNLVVTGIAPTGGNFTSFSQTNNCGTVAASGTCTINVTFTPQAAGALASQICVTDNAPASPQCFNVSGTGAAIGNIGFNPASLTFPNQAVTTTSAAMNFTATNSGGSPISISSIAVTGTNASNFAQTNNCGASLAAGGSCTVSVKFTPSANGSRTAAITFTDSAPGSPQSVSLQGVGFTPTPAVTLSTSAIAFGNQTVSTQSNPQVVIVMNTGTAALTISTGTMGGANPGDFGFSTTCSASLAVNASCTYSLMFSPTTGGARAATFSVNTNAASSPNNVSLTGTGITTPPGAPAPQVFGF
jgi:hypothetical protein